MKAVSVALAAILVCSTALAQQVQIPTVQACNIGKASGAAQVYLSKRDDLSTAGTIDITVADVGCDNVSGDGYPTGAIKMKISLTDSAIGEMETTSIEQMTTVGKHTPTTYMNGRCTANGGTIPCRFWLMLSDNKPSNLAGTADVVSLLVLDKKGNTLTYGTGPVKTGDISVTQF